jgi:hypothetical protein
VLGRSREGAVQIKSEMSSASRLDELRVDMSLLAVALARSRTDTGERISLEDAAKSFGIDLAELTGGDDRDNEG